MNVWLVPWYDHGYSDIGETTEPEAIACAGYSLHATRESAVAVCEQQPQNLSGAYGVKSCGWGQPCFGNAAEVSLAGSPLLVQAMKNDTGQGVHINVAHNGHNAELYNAAKALDSHAAEFPCFPKAMAGMCTSEGRVPVARLTAVGS